MSSSSYEAKRLICHKVADLLWEVGGMASLASNMITPAYVDMLLGGLPAVTTVSSEKQGKVMLQGILGIDPDDYFTPAQVSCLFQWFQEYQQLR